MANSDLAAPLLASLYHEEYRPPFLPVLVIVPYLLPAFWKYSVDVTNDSLSFGFSWNIFRKSVARSQIESATVVPESNGLCQWGGWGVRLTAEWGVGLVTGYIATNGPGVRIATRNHNKDSSSIYVFSCQDPESVCNILNSSRK
jgi:hypothetical protein